MRLAAALIIIQLLSVVVVCALQVPSNNSSVFPACIDDVITRLQVNAMLTIKQSRVSKLNELLNRWNALNNFTILLSNAQLTSRHVLIEYCHPNELEAFLNRSALSQRQRYVALSNCRMVGNESKVFWNHYISNFIIVDDDGIFSWYPFENGGCGRHITMQRIASCEDGRVTKQIRPFFEDKIPSNLNNCTLRVTTTYFPPFVLNESYGAEIALVHILARKLNFTPSVDIVDNIALQQLEANQTDLVLSSFSLILSRYLLFDYTEWYHSDWYLLCTKKVPQRHDFEKLQRIGVTQIVLIVPLFLHAYLTHRLAYQTSDYRFRSLNYMIWYYVTSMCGLGNVHLPQSSAVRFLYGGWLVFVLILLTKYQTLLISVFNSLAYLPLARTLQEAMEVDLKIYLPAHLTRYYSPEFIKRYATLFVGALRTIREYLTSKRTVLGIQESIMRFHKQWFIEDGRMTLFCFRRPISVLQIRIYTRRNFYLNRLLDRAVKRLNWGGVFPYILRHIVKPVDQSEIVETAEVEQEEGDDGGTLDFQDFIPIYVYLLLGIVISTITFIGEHIYHAIKMKKRAESGPAMSTMR